MKTLLHRTLISTLLVWPNLGLADNHSADLGLKSNRPLSPSAKIDIAGGDTRRSEEVGKKDPSNLMLERSENDSASKKERPRDRFKDQMKSRGGGDAGGGDPLLIHAISYPDVAGLDRAIEIVKDKLQVSAYPENFKSRIIAEISALKDADLFRYIPEIIILPSLGNSDTEGGGKDVIADDQTFMSLGGMTWLKPNAAVIFSNRAKQYTAEDLAELLLHEVIHHVVSNSLSRDEDFVEELAGSIISGQKNSKLEQALQIGAYFRQELISADQLWDAIESDRSEAEGLSLFAYVNKRFICGIFAGNLRGPDCVQEMLDFQKAYVVSHLPHNLIDVRVGKVWQVLNEANYAAFQRGSSIGNMVVGAFLTSYMNRLAKKTNPQAPDLQFEKHIFGGTQVKNSKQINNLLMKEYFLPKQR